MKTCLKLILVALFLFVNCSFLVGRCGDEPFEDKEYVERTINLYVNGDLMIDSVYTIASDGVELRINSNDSFHFGLIKAYANDNSIYDFYAVRGSMDYRTWCLSDSWYDIHFEQPQGETDDTMKDHAKLYLVVSIQPNETTTERTLAFEFLYAYGPGKKLILRQSFHS